MSKIIKTAIILAGGLGTRLRSVVADVPKPMARVNGKPFLWHLIRYWENQGIEHFVISIGYKGDVIKEYFNDSFGKARIDYVSEEFALGTGGALLACLSEHPQNEAIILLNGDSYFPVDLRALSQSAINQNADWCLSLFKTTEKNRYLLLQIDAKGNLIREKDNDAINNNENIAYANGGVYWLNPMSLIVQENFSFPLSLENELLENQIRSGKKIVGFQSDSPFIDIGLPADFFLAQDLPFFSKS
jgi:D-glycero-alpha-D-manno-heptose 1-phosphate guanylyltransferase